MRLLLLMLLALVAFQAKAQDENASEAAERTCIPADEVEQATSGESGPSEQGTVETDEAGLPVCEEEVEEPRPESEPGPDSEQEPEPATDEGDESDTDETESGEIDPEEEFEVDPEDEISEDYPVPLPSDI